MRTQFFKKVSSKKGRITWSDPVSSDEIIRMAGCLLKKRFRRGTTIKRPIDIREYLATRLMQYEHEVFAGLFLDNRHRIIAWEEMFRGTIDGASIHPREVVKLALRHNAAAVIFAHNHA